MIDLNKYIVSPPGDDKPFHTSGYAAAANGGSLGSTDSRSFAQRQKIASSRRMVGGYNRSNMGQSYAALRAKTVLPGGTPAAAATSPTGSPPAKQPYNPYA